MRSPAFTTGLTDQESARRRVSYATAQLFASQRLWAYPCEQENLLKELVQPLDGELHERLGYQALMIISLWGKLRDRIYARLTFFHRLRSAINHRTIAQHSESLIAAAITLGVPALTQGILHIQDATRQQEFLTQQAAALYTFTKEELSEIANSDSPGSDLFAYLQECTLEPSSLRDKTLDDVLTDNPFWERPILGTPRGEYFILLPSTFHSFAFQHLERLYARADLASRWENRRAKYLEQRLGQLLQKAFPAARLFAGSHYPVPGAEPENDLMLQDGNWLLVVEAKAPKLNRAARRGAYNSLKDRLTELILEPARQSARCADYLATHSGIQSLRVRKGAPNIIDTRHTVRVLRLSITLEWLGSISAQANALRQLGMMPEHYRLAVTMSLFDLALIIDTLPSEEERWDYLFRRNAILDARHDGDERDLLAFYIAGQLRATRAADDVLRIGGWHHILDDHYLRLLERRKPIRYQRQYTMLWRNVIAFLRDQHQVYWPEAAIMLLSFTIEEQRSIEEELRRNRKNPDTVVARRISTPGWQETFLVCFTIQADNAIARAQQEFRAEIDRHFADDTADHAMLITLRNTSPLRPVTVLVLTKDHAPRWI